MCKCDEKGCIRCAPYRIMWFNRHRFMSGVVQTFKAGTIETVLNVIEDSNDGNTYGVFLFPAKGKIA